MLLLLLKRPACTGNPSLPATFAAAVVAAPHAARCHPTIASSGRQLAGPKQQPYCFHAVQEATTQRQTLHLLLLLGQPACLEAQLGRCCCCGAACC